MAAAAELFEWIEYVERIIINEAVRSSRCSLRMPEQVLDLRDGGASTNQRADSARVELVQLRVRDIGWRGDQSTGLIETKRQNVGAIAMAQWIGCVDVWPIIHAELMGESRTVADNVITGARTEPDIMRIILKRIRKTQLGKNQEKTCNANQLHTSHPWLAHKQ